MGRIRDELARSSACRNCERKPRAHRTDTAISFVAASASVNTLGLGEGLHSASKVPEELLLGKTHIFQDQSDDHSFVIVGVHEGRAREQGVRNVTHYTTFCSASDNGSCNS